MRALFHKLQEVKSAVVSLISVMGHRRQLLVHVQPSYIWNPWLRTHCTSLVDLAISNKGAWPFPFSGAWGSPVPHILFDQNCNSGTVTSGRWKLQPGKKSFFIPLVNFPTRLKKSLRVQKGGFADWSLTPQRQAPTTFVYTKSTCCTNEWFVVTNRTTSFGAVAASFEDSPPHWLYPGGRQNRSAVNKSVSW